MKRCVGLALTGVVAAALASGCGSSGESPPPTAGLSGTAEAGGTIVVFAAASLKKSFTDIGEQFKTDNPGAIGGVFVRGIVGSGDPVDPGRTLPTCSPPLTPTIWIRLRKPAYSPVHPVNFASNTLTIAVAPGNPKNITSFQDLTRPGLNVVACAPPVPCGSATQKVENRPPGFS